MRQRDKVTLHVNVDRQVLDNFEKIYPRCRSRLIQNLLKLVCDDKILFDKIFFCDMLKNHDSDFL